MLVLDLPGCLDMLLSPTPADETDRQAALDHSHVLQADSQPFDELTALARSIFNVPISLVSLIDHDRQFFLSHDGIDAQEMPRSTSFCGHVLLEPEILVIEDARTDRRFAGNPFVVNAPKVRFYAGVPIRVPGENGQLYTIGSFCIVDFEPRSFGEAERDQLKLLARSAERQMLLERSLTTDTLTGLLNRHGLEQAGERAIAAAKRDFKALTAIFFDLNGLKAINDGPGGHKAGDEAIKGFADCLKAVSRRSDTASRLSGDEYVVLMSGATADGAKELCDRLDDALSRYNSIDRGYTLSYSAGIATLKPHQSLRQLISEADKLMYADKAQKKAFIKAG